MGINGLLGINKIMSEMKLPEEAKKCVEIIESCSNGLLTLINDILDISKLNSNRFLIENNDYCLGEVVTEVSHVIGVKIHEKGLALKINVSET